MQIYSDKAHNETKELLISPDNLAVPYPILEKIEELNKMVYDNPDYIGLVKVSKFLGVIPDGLRSSIERGQCPFGLCWKNKMNGRRAYKIPTITFYLWYTQGIGYKNILNEESNKYLIINK